MIKNFKTETIDCACGCGERLNRFDNKNRIRKSIKGHLLRYNRTGFQKGFHPWNKDTKGIMKVNKTSFKKGVHYSPKTEFKKGERLNEDHPNWKGNKAGYNALHAWVKGRLIKPINCDHCGLNKPLDLANKSQLYKRDITDWLWLCKKCHVAYDDILSKSWITRRKNIERRLQI